MRRRFSFALVVSVLLFSILACSVVSFGDSESELVRGSGSVGEENRTVSNITGVELSMQGTLQIAMGSSDSLRVEAEDNLLQYIQTNVSGGRLEIKTRQGIDLRPTRPIKYFLTVGKLNAIQISSSGDVNAEDLQSESLSLTISSSGNLSIGNLDGTSLKVRISSSGNVEIEGGQVQQQNISISSSGEYRASDLASVTADVTLTSSGKATIRVSDRLSGRLSSSGNIYYIGSPDVNVSTTSSGKTVKINE